MGISSQRLGLSGRSVKNSLSSAELFFGCKEPHTYFVALVHFESRDRFSNVSSSKLSLTLAAFSLPMWELAKPTNDNRPATHARAGRTYIFGQTWRVTWREIELGGRQLEEITREEILQGVEIRPQLFPKCAKLILH